MSLMNVVGTEMKVVALSSTSLFVDFKLFTSAGSMVTVSSRPFAESDLDVWPVSWNSIPPVLADRTIIPLVTTVLLATGSLKTNLIVSALTSNANDDTTGLLLSWVYLSTFVADATSTGLIWFVSTSSIKPASNETNVDVLDSASAGSSLMLLASAVPRTMVRMDGSTLASTLALSVASFVSLCDEVAPSFTFVLWSVSAVASNLFPATVSENVTVIVSAVMSTS